MFNFKLVPDSKLPDLEHNAQGKMIARLVASVLAVIELIYVVISIHHKLYLVGCLLVASAVYYLTYALTSDRSIFSSRVLFIVVSNVTVVTFSILLGREVGGQYFFFSCLGLSIILFAPTERTNILGSLLFTSLCFVSLEILDYSFWGISHPSPELQLYLSRFTLPGPMLILFVEVVLFYMVQHKAQIEIKQTVLKLKDQESMLKKLESTGKIGYWDCDLENGKILWSDEIYRMHNRTIGTVIKSHDVLDVYERPFVNLLQNNFEKCFKEEIPSFSMEIPMEGSTKEGRWMRVFGKRWVADDGHVHVVGTTQDITELMNVKIKGQEIEKSLQRVLKNAPGLFYQMRLAPDGGMSMPYVSDRIEQITGLTQRDFAESKRSLLSFVHPDDREDYTHSLVKSARTLGSRCWEGRCITPLGDIKWIRAVSTPLREPDGSIVWDGVMVDITEQKHLEEKLKQAQIESFAANRLAALGQMAGGIAHEINNPIFIISGYSRKLQMQLLAGKDDKKIMLDGLTRIQKTCNRISSTIKGMLQLARQKIDEPLEIVTVASIAAETLSLCEAFLKSKGVVVKTDIDASLQLHCRPTEISQVILNLINNADDALEKSEVKWIAISARADDEKVFISITDSGAGIGKDIRDKIMTPFFTTKDVGKGTGLGLSICRGIVESHKGTISLNLRSEHTSFEICLPKVLAEPKKVQQALS